MKRHIMSRVEIEIRKASPADKGPLAYMHVAAWKETYTGLLPEKVLSDLNVKQRSVSWVHILRTKAQQSDAMVALALNEGNLIGFVSVGRQRDEALLSRGFSGEIEALYVLAADQRKGVGRTLLSAGTKHLFKAGHTSASLWVLARNQTARSFYEAIGGGAVWLLLVKSIGME